MRSIILVRKKDYLLKRRKKKNQKKMIVRYKMFTINLKKRKENNLKMTVKVKNQLSKNKNLWKKLAVLKKGQSKRRCIKNQIQC